MQGIWGSASVQSMASSYAVFADASDDSLTIYYLGKQQSKFM
jgi:hypothetical protein